MKLAVEMAVMDIGGEISAVAVGEDSSKFHGMLRLNESAAEIIRLLAEDTTPERLEKALAEKYDESTEGEIRQNVAEFLGILRKEGLLLE
ncbi:MAG: PqqD family protein [Ruminococcus sp.]|nr:PqqD family protein [Ruminococcus sp.]